MEERQDLISRQAAIDAMTTTLWHYPNGCYRNLNEYEFAKGLAELGLKSVPSAQPELKKGKWIDATTDESLDQEWRCSECGWNLFLTGNLTNFCPNCGADMRGEQNG